jgi:glycosyltransferase involved in cell wall biosynthesis
MGGLARVAFTCAAHYLRLWDLAAASRVDYFVANSHNVAKRIRKHYRRDAPVIPPPIDISEGFVTEDIHDYYLVLGRLVDYKRVDLVIEACNLLGRHLIVVGGGPKMKELQKLAGPTVRFLGQVPRETVRQAYAHCRALLFAGEEDFGLVPLEAQSFGRPVIAFGRGGALETVRGIWNEGEFSPQATGVFFREQSAASLLEAIQLYESVERQFSPNTIQARAGLFDESNFERKMKEFVMCKMYDFRKGTREVPFDLPDSCENELKQIGID